MNMEVHVVDGTKPNIKLSDDDYEFITRLEKFDLEMLISEVRDHGWRVAKVTLGMMKEALDD